MLSDASCERLDLETGNSVAASACSGGHDVARIRSALFCRGWAYSLYASVFLGLGGTIDGPRRCRACIGRTDHAIGP